MCITDLFFTGFIIHRDIFIMKGFTGMTAAITKDGIRDIKDTENINGDITKLKNPEA